MKKLLTLIAILTLLTLPALSEAAQNIVLDAPMDADLNGDGAMETVTWTYAPDEEGEDWLCLEIKDENGATPPGGASRRSCSTPAAGSWCPTNTTPPPATACCTA